MENDDIATTAAGVNLTFNGAGLDNEGTLTASGGIVTLAGAANVNRGNLNLSALNLTGATLINNGSLVFTGGSVSGVSGSLDNAVGGTISGTANITTGFSNAGGTLLVGSGTTNFTSSFSNSGLIQLTAANADLVGGTIGNPAAGTIQGLGIVGNSIVNSGTVESMGGTLTLNGQLTNPTGGLLAVDAGSKMLVTQGLTANAGIINLTGGTFDNGGLRAEQRQHRPNQRLGHLSHRRHGIRQQRQHHFFRRLDHGERTGHQRKRQDDHDRPKSRPSSPAW